MTAHYVYRCFDADGALLYVGCSKDPWSRFQQHKATSVWAHLANRGTIAVYPRRVLALAAERHAIRTEDPRFNNHGRWSTRHGWTAQQFVDFSQVLLATGHNRPRLARLFDEYRIKFGEPHPLAEAARAVWVETDERRAADLAIRTAESTAARLKSDAEDAQLLVEHLAVCELCRTEGGGQYALSCGDEEAVA
jgi:predicted GIY-YIG superfamily endonuclease